VAEKQAINFILGGNLEISSGGIGPPGLKSVLSAEK
jgi:hypothetical protein